MWSEIEGIVTSLNAMQDFTKLKCFLPSFKALVAKWLLEWTRVSWSTSTIILICLKERKEVPKKKKNCRP